MNFINSFLLYILIPNEYAIININNEIAYNKTSFLPPIVRLSPSILKKPSEIGMIDINIENKMYNVIDVFINLNLLFARFDNKRTTKDDSSSISTLNIFGIVCQVVVANTNPAALINNIPSAKMILPFVILFFLIYSSKVVFFSFCYTFLFDEDLATSFDGFDAIAFLAIFSFLSNLLVFTSLYLFKELFSFCFCLYQYIKS